MQLWSNIGFECNYDQTYFFWCRYKLDHILLRSTMYTEALALHLPKCIKNVLHRSLTAYSKATTPRFLLMARLVPVKHTQWAQAAETTAAKQGSYLKSWTLFSPRLRLSRIISSFRYTFLSSRLVLDKHGGFFVWVFPFNVFYFILIW